MQKNNFLSQGFTLIEVITVIVILSIVAVLGTKFVVDSTKSYQTTQTRSRLVNTGRQAVERMKGALLDILNRHFDGKVRTATLTTWTQKTLVYEVSGADAAKHPQYFKTTEPTLQKSKIIEQFKAAVAMPEDINVVESYSESVRVKR